MSDINIDVLDLSDKIADKVMDLVAAVDTLDGNVWILIADQILSLNEQLQALTLPPEPTPASKTK